MTTSDTDDPTASAAVLRAADSAAWTEPVATPSATAVLSAAAGTVTQGRVVAREASRLARELLRIAKGSSSVAAAKGDWRFADPTWNENPIYRRVGQAYLSFAGSMDRLVDELERSGKDADRARFAVTLLTSAVAPTNFLPGNPAAIKKTFETGGRNLIRGIRNWADDVRHNGGLPSMADRKALQVGRDLALTAGAVVERDEVAELIQYTPTTETVRDRPVLVVPPPIGRYYFLDLSPGRSFVEYSVASGLQTFLISWRNPGPEQGDWDLDVYASRVLKAIDAVREITGSDDVNTIGFCAGGIITTGVLNHLAATGDARIKSASFAVTLLDFGQRAPIHAFSSAKLLSVARSRTRRAGVIAARDMGAAFTFMRPNDLIWNYWVNNYLMGQTPAVFDILSWNADGTNLPGALHLQFLDLFETNLLCHPGAMKMLDTPVDLSTIKVPTFVTGAMTDHLTPWKGCYRTTQLLSGPMTFVLSTSGHIQSLVNPPGNPKASYYTGDQPGDDADEWLTTATKHAGSWWQAWADWIIPHSGSERPAPQSPGSPAFEPITPAPGGLCPSRTRIVTGSGARRPAHATRRRLTPERGPSVPQRHVQPVRPDVTSTRCWAAQAYSTGSPPRMSRCSPATSRSSTRLAERSSAARASPATACTSCCPAK
jgi:polyhydroxyalkanoate synthase subunit PhaC